MSIDRNNREYSKQEIIDRLNATIQLEESKPISERDVDLIEECVDYLMELEQGVALSQEELEKEKQKIYDYNKELYKPKKNIRFKGLLVAACFAVIMLLANFTAMACGIDTIAILKEFGSRIVEMFTGEKEEFNGITIIKNNESIEYDSIEAFLKEEKLNILYPTKLPEGVNLSCIYVIDDTNKDISINKRIKFTTTSSNLNISLKMNTDENTTFLSNSNLTVQIVNEHECYIFDQGSYYQFDFIFNDFVYTIIAPSTEESITIIENLKEIE